MKANKKKLICLMIDADMNNKRLSEVSGVSLPRISNIRNGHGTTYETISKLADALGVPVADLIENGASVAANNNSESEGTAWTTSRQ